MTVGENPVEYAPRSLVSLPVDQVRGWTVKRYGISASRPRPPDRVVEAARVAVEMTLPDSYGTGFAYAFSVVHEDADGCYVVVGWWSRNRVILHTRTWLSSWDDPAAWTPAGGGATACVWELVAVAHERDAWVRHVVTALEPRFADYLAETVSGMY